MSRLWVVQMEIVCDGATQLEGDAFDELLREVADCNPSLLRSKGRYALVLHVAANSAIDAHGLGITRWRRALRRVEAAERRVVRVEVVTAEEFERDCWTTAHDEEFALAPHDARESDLADELLRDVLQDPLTSLPAAEAFRASLQDILNRRQDGQRRHALIVLDLGEVPPSPGSRQRAEDLALRAAAEEAVRSTRGTDLAGRLGLRTLGLLMKDVGKEDVAALARRALAMLHEPVVQAAAGSQIRGSVGVSIGRPGDDADRVVAGALAALHAAKANGGGHWALFPDDLAQSAPPTTASIWDPHRIRPDKP